MIMVSPGSSFVQYLQWEDYPFMADDGTTSKMLCPHGHTFSSRWWGCYAIYLRGSRLLTRQLCVRCAQVYSHRPIQHIRDAFVMPRYIVTKLPTPFYCSCHLFLSLMSSAIFYSINSPNSTHPNITVPEPLLDCWDYRYAVPATKKYSSTTLSQPVVFPLKRLVLSMFFSMCRCHWRLI